jgi:hypothetical protein
LNSEDLPLAFEGLAGSNSKLDLRRVVEAYNGPAIKIIPASHWPLLYVYAGQIETVTPTLLITSQRYLDARIIRHKLGLIPFESYYADFGVIGACSLTPRAANEFLLWDGHHNLAAALIAGLPLETWIYPARASGDYIAAPHLRGR